MWPLPARVKTNTPLGFIQPENMLQPKGYLKKIKKNLFLIATVETVETLTTHLNQLKAVPPSDRSSHMRVAHGLHEVFPHSERTLF